MTSRSAAPAPPAGDHALALAWGAWTELGVSGWTATHGRWAIDPEPVVFLVAFLGDRDPRLRDETTDWCVAHWRFLSKARLKSLARRFPAVALGGFGEFAATVSAHAPVSWPGAGRPRAWVPTGRSELPPLERPSLAWLRLRAAFGIGARSEILRVLLSGPDRAMTLTGLADATSYTKRNVTDAADALHRAGLLAAVREGNRLNYRLARRAALEALLGSLPDIRPDWVAVVRVAMELVSLEDTLVRATPRTAAVKVAQTLQRIQPDLTALRLALPGAEPATPAGWSARRDAANRVLAGWAHGQWPV